jgi:hypothetical protein
MRHTFQEAAGAAVCALLVAVLLNVPAFGQEHHPLPVPIQAHAKAVPAAPAHAVQAMAVPQVRDLAAMHSNLTDKLRGAFKLAVDLLSGNETHLLSDIEAELLSNNKAALLSGNKPEILSGNQMPILSGNRVSILSNLKIEIHIENSGNHPGMPMPGMPGMSGTPGPTTRPSAVPMHSTAPVTRPVPAAPTVPAVPSTKPHD